jgi:RHS repeat-associated protein
VAIYKSKDDSTEETLYLHRDHLGSVAEITRDNGNWVESMAYDVFGKRVNASTWAGPAALPANTPRGYTGHEQLDDIGLIHMNGRVYDPDLGRMISADPFVQAPRYSQSFNRYSYVFNNPLAYTDPSGFFGEDESVNVDFLSEDFYGDPSETNPNCPLECQLERAWRFAEFRDQSRSAAILGGLRPNDDAYYGGGASGTGGGGGSSGGGSAAPSGTITAAYTGANNETVLAGHAVLFGIAIAQSRAIVIAQAQGNPAPAARVTDTFPVPADIAVNLADFETLPAQEQSKIREWYAENESSIWRVHNEYRPRTAFDRILTLAGLSPWVKYALTGQGVLRGTLRTASTASTIADARAEVIGQGHRLNRTQYMQHIRGFSIWAGIPVEGFPVTFSGIESRNWGPYAELGGNAYRTVDFYYWVNDVINSRPGTCVIFESC